MIFKVVEYVKDFMLWLENIISGRLTLLYAEICLKIFLNSSSGCSVFDLNQNVLVFFSGRTILSTFILKNPIPNSKFSGKMLFRDILLNYVDVDTQRNPIKYTAVEKWAIENQHIKNFIIYFLHRS
jgi:hypothetical protein